jgi:hypothetical protein
MQKILRYSLLISFVIFVASISSVKAQWVYGSSTLGYDPVDNEVFSYSRTWVDAYVGLDYDPYVNGRLYRINQQVDSGEDLGWAQYRRAEVNLDTASTPVTQFTILSEHWIKRATYTDVIVLDDVYRFWWDPWGFSTFSPVYGSSYPGWGYYQWIVPQWTYLGYTAVSGITPPLDTCEDNVLPPEAGILAFQGPEPESSAPCPTPTPTPNVTAAITSVGFSGNHTLHRFEGELGPITNPTWVNGRTDNQNYPVAYTKGTETTNMKLSATLTLTPAIPSGNSVSAQIRVKKGSSDVITAPTSVTLTGSSVTVNDIAINKSLEATPKVKKSNYNFAWEISFDGGSSWRSMGNSGPHPVYWTFNNPKPDLFKTMGGITYDLLYDKALEKVTMELGEGETNEEQIVTKLNKAIDRDLVYNPGEVYSNTLHPLSLYDPIWEEAQCSGNANLLTGLLRSVGIDAKTYYFYGGDRSPLANRVHFYKYTAGYDTNGQPVRADQSFQVSRPPSPEGTGPADIEMNPHFTFHAMTKVTSIANKRFDPSYGIVNTGANFIAKEVADYTSPVKKFKFNGDTVNYIIERDSPITSPPIKHDDWICKHRGSGLFLPSAVRSFDDDDITDIAFWRPSDGVWYVINSSDDSLKPTQWGSSGDIIVPGDYDRDGYTDHAVFRPFEGKWYIRQSSSGNMQVATFGLSTDKPVPADYDGDGKTDVAVFRPSNGTWFINRSSDGGLTSVTFGLGSDKVVPGDYDGDSIADIAVWRPSDGVWYIIESSTNSYRFVQFGTIHPDTVPVPGDYDNDSKTDLAVWNRADSFWHILPSNGGTSWTVYFGNKIYGDVAVQNDYDGDGKTDVAVWRSSNATWYILRSSDGVLQEKQWGATQDIPVPSNP